MSSVVQPIVWAEDRLQLLDQRLLPHEVVMLDCRSAAEVAKGIHDMAVRAISGQPVAEYAEADGAASEAANVRIDAPDLDVDADSVLVLRGCGPTGLRTLDMPSG